MPTPAKHPDRRQRRSSPGFGLIDGAAPLEMPKPPRSWLAGTKREWVSYWQSPAATLLVEADVPALTRLFGYRDDLERASRLYVAEPEWRGSTGQPKVSGWADQVSRLEGLIRPLEDRFGMSPKARLSLGVTFASAAISLDDLNRRITEADGDDEPDPRAGAIDATSSRS